MKKTLLLFCIILSAGAASAQVVAGSSFFDEIVSDWHMGITADVMQSAAISSDLHKDANGTMGAYKTKGSLKFQGVRGNHAVDVSFGWSHSYYDFTKISPFSDTNEAFANLFYSYKVNEKWSGFVLARGAFASESGADLSDGGRLIAGAGVGYAINENLRFGLGAMAVSRMDNTWIPLPVGYIQWNIDKHWSVRTLSGVAVIYDVYGDGKLLLNATCEYTNTYFRLSKSDTGAKRSVGDNVVDFVVGATYNIGENFYLSASVGANIYRRLQFRHGGNSAEEVDVDPTPVFFVHAGCKF